MAREVFCTPLTQGSPDIDTPHSYATASLTLDFTKLGDSCVSRRKSDFTLSKLHYGMPYPTSHRDKALCCGRSHHQLECRNSRAGRPASVKLCSISRLLSGRSRSKCKYNILVLHLQPIAKTDPHSNNSLKLKSQTDIFC